MLEFSYWLFPVLILVFVIFEKSRIALFPGILAACAAGAANSIVAGKYLYAWLHAVVGWLVTAAYVRMQAEEDDEMSKFLRLTAPLAWATLALIIVVAIPQTSWPYALSKPQMGQLFVMALPFGGLI